MQLEEGVFSLLALKKDEESTCIAWPYIAAGAQRPLFVGYEWIVACSGTIFEQFEGSFRVVYQARLSAQLRGKKFGRTPGSRRPIGKHWLVFVWLLRSGYTG